MAKEIPYFKFYISDWSNGDITLESFELQGVFINVCAYYWSKDCSLSLDNVKKKFRNVSSSIDELIKCSCIKNIGGNISISFLNEQMDSKEVQKAINRNNGSKGGRPPKEETENKPNRLILDNQNITNIKKRKEDKIVNVEFSVFWNLYNKKVGDKIRCEKKWNKLKDTDREKIIDMIPFWKSQFSNIQFQPFPETFLNQKRWEDVIENNSEDDIDMNTYQLN